MEETMHPQSLKVTIKRKKRDKNVSNSSTASDLNNAEEERNASDSSGPTETLNTFCEDQVDVSHAEEREIHGTINEGNQTSESSQNQLVPYDPAVNGAGNSENALDPINSPPPFRRPHPFSDLTPRVLPSIGAFTVQCANCFKWRLVPTKEKYEEIREHLLEQPFLCETAREWRPDISCDDPHDISPDGSRLWAIDKPNIAQPPPGWQRLLRIRGEGGSKFADVYYIAPSGKSLRSKVEIQRYLDKHPEYMQEGVCLSRFSFQIPKPLQDDYVRKRPSCPAVPNDTSDLEFQGNPPPPKVAKITWVSDEDTDLQLPSPALANDHLKEPVSKRRRGPSP